jgi:hypothetical protein
MGEILLTAHPWSKSGKVYLWLDAGIRLTCRARPVHYLPLHIRGAAGPFVELLPMRPGGSTVCLKNNMMSKIMRWSAGRRGGNVLAYDRIWPLHNQSPQRSISPVFRGLPTAAFSGTMGCKGSWGARGDVLGWVSRGWCVLRNVSVLQCTMEAMTVVTVGATNVANLPIGSAMATEFDPGAPGSHRGRRPPKSPWPQLLRSVVTRECLGTGCSPPGLAPPH